MWHIGLLDKWLGLYHETSDGADWSFDGKPLLDTYEHLIENSSLNSDKPHYPYSSYAANLDSSDSFTYRHIVTAQTPEELKHIIKNFSTLYPELYV